MRAALPSDTWLVRNLIGYGVLRYEDAVGILRDKRWHSASARIPELMGITRADFLARQRGSILSTEGDEHVRLRRLVAPAFNPRAADRLRPFMRDVMNGLVDPVAAAGRADFVADITEPYPIPIICELLGAPKSDWQLFSRLATDILEIFSADLADKIDLVMAAQDEMDAYTRELIAERRSKPADDLLTDLIAAEEAGDKLTNDELVMMVNAVIVAGTDTTRNQLGCAVAMFAQHPEQWALLAERPGAGRPGRRGGDALLRRRAWHRPVRQLRHRVPRRGVPDRHVHVDRDRRREPSGRRVPRSRHASTSPSRRPSSRSSRSDRASTTAWAPRSPAPSCRRRCPCSLSGCRTCASTARSPGSPTAWASSDRRTCRSGSTRADAIQPTGRLRRPRRTRRRAVRSRGCRRRGRRPCGSSCRRRSCRARGR